MGNVNYQTGWTSLEYTYRQQKIGAIQVETMFYDHQQRNYRLEIKICQDDSEEEGFGREIFTGNLEELIEALQEYQSMRKLLHSVSLVEEVARELHGGSYEDLSEEKRVDVLAEAIDFVRERKREREYERL